MGCVENGFNIGGSQGGCGGVMCEDVMCEMCLCVRV